MALAQALCFKKCKLYTQPQASKVPVVKHTVAQFKSYRAGSCRKCKVAVWYLDGGACQDRSGYKWIKWINNMLCQCVGRLCSVDPLPMIRNRLGHQPSMEATAT